MTAVAMPATVTFVPLDPSLLNPTRVQRGFHRLRHAISARRPAPKPVAPGADGARGYDKTAQRAGEPRWPERLTEV
jgi:hypothetical protein